MNLLQTWKRWLIWGLLVCVFAVACFFLSQWQLGRRAEAVARMQLVAQNFDQSPQAISALADFDSFDKQNEWRPVKLTGKFLSDHAVLVRNKPFNGSPGFLQLVPFKLSSGQIVAVETGWLPTGSDNDVPKVIPVPDTAQQEIIARVRAVEPSLNRDAPAGQLATINVDALIEKESLIETEELSGTNYYRSIYLRLANSYHNLEYPKILPKPELTEGNHLSYAFQWILFALMGFAALIWAIRQELEAKRIQTDPNYQPKLRKKFGAEDNAAEDNATEIRPPKLH